MLLATVRLVAANGATAVYEGAFNYRIDVEGAIVSLRAFWDLPAVATGLTGGDQPDVDEPLQLAVKTRGGK